MRIISAFWRFAQHRVSAECSPKMKIMSVRIAGFAQTVGAKVHI
jgi:hypothetical protein